MARRSDARSPNRVGLGLRKRAEQTKERIGHGVTSPRTPAPEGLVFERAREGRARAAEALAERLGRDPADVGRVAMIQTADGDEQEHLP